MNTVFFLSFFLHLFILQISIVFGVFHLVSFGLGKLIIRSLEVSSSISEEIEVRQQRLEADLPTTIDPAIRKLVLNFAMLN